jgi:hypothetical protein
MTDNILRISLEFDGVTYRWNDWYIALAFGRETTVFILMNLCVHGIQVTICIINADVPDTLVSFLGG